MIKQLTKLASHLDSKGLVKEADYLDGIMRKIASQLSGPSMGESLYEAVLDCSKREAHHGKLSCVQWKTVEARAERLYPNLTIPKCGTGWKHAAKISDWTFGDCPSSPAPGTGSKKLT